MPQKPKQFGRGKTGRGEAASVLSRVEALTAGQSNGRSGMNEERRGLMERAVERLNCLAALQRVKANKGSPGIDNMSVEELPAYLKANWTSIRKALLAGTYQPQPVRRVVIPKPGGGERLLGIPTVLDRFIQQLLLQVLQPIFDPTFSENSYGFRPGRRAHDAVRRAQGYVREGRRFVVDVDLEKFFDRVNHDILMGRLARRIADKRVLKLIRLYLEAGVMMNGVAVRRHEGTPQGGPLSPLLANVVCPAWALIWRWKSSRELVTASVGKRRVLGREDSMKEAWNETAGRRTGIGYEALLSRASGPLTAKLS